MLDSYWARSLRRAPLHQANRDIGRIQLSNLTSLRIGSSLGFTAALVLALCVAPGCDRLEPADGTQTSAPASDHSDPTPKPPWAAPPDGWRPVHTDLPLYETDLHERRAAHEGPFHGRIVISPSLIAAENVTTLSALEDDARRALHRLAQAQRLTSIWHHARVDLIARRVPPSQRDGAFLLPSIERAVDAWSRLHEGPEALSIAIEAHPETTYQQLFAVSYSAWAAAPRARLSLRVQLDEPANQIATIADVLSTPSHIGACDASSPPCAAPLIEAYGHGFQVRAIPGRPAELGPTAPTSAQPCPPNLQTAREGALPRKDAHHDWAHRLMLLDEALCPSVPAHDDGSFDSAGLVELLNDLEAMAPGCLFARWTALPELSWRSLAGPLGHAAAQTDFRHVRFARPLPSDPSPPDCAQAMRP